MLSFVLLLLGYIFAFGMGILVMIFGWGLQPVSWGWIIFGGLSGSIIGAIIGVTGK